MNSEQEKHSFSASLKIQNHPTTPLTHQTALSTSLTQLHPQTTKAPTSITIFTTINSQLTPKPNLNPLPQASNNHSATSTSPSTTRLVKSKKGREKNSSLLDSGSLPHVQEVLLRFRRRRAVKDSESTVTDRDSDSGDGVEMEAIFLKGNGFVVKEKKIKKL
ncbi:hypothetical protein PVK06_020704 [Gossypium arboreum]|uniref:Uncharacterized protein n=1 Tax=Gossypium arboreum TaxID=29729 RepID=A0ABR0PNG1_GOSAR|nr:hypothetical protein PVK06_020704 [Gossypium arboreum]